MTLRKTWVEQKLESIKKTTPHGCSGNLPYGIRGAALEACDEQDDGTLWVSNGFYDSQVNYCPYCGYRAKVKVK